jgi:hypothetical protein
MQLAAVTHSTHVIVSLQTALEHIDSVGNGSFDGTPALQASVVHSLPSTGKSISLAFVTSCPSRHAGCLQSPTISSIKSPLGMAVDWQIVVPGSQ